MNKSITKKLILSVASLAATTICLTSTTYAWFAKNANAWTEDFTVKIHTFEGLQISVDGTHFYDSIDRNQMLRAIALSRYNLENDNAPKTYSELTDAEVTSYSQTALAPVSPDNKFDFYGFGTVDNPKENWDDRIINGLYTPINLTAEKTAKSYIQFDLYFRAIPSSNDPKDVYDLVFVDETYAAEKEVSMSYVEALPSEVALNNKLNVPVSKDTRTGDNIVPGLYVSGDTISINPKDAMRIGVRGTEGDLIYEINEGLGSSAYNNYPTTEADFDLHDPNQNPMVTYFNNSHTKGDLYIKDYSEYVETIKNFNDLNVLGKFNKNDQGEYNDVKITVYLWLDGYDADYLEGVNTESVHFYLNFTKVGE
ncbi:MAG: hypothetical protein K6B64_05445 [Acholeplasmatales bacterium]|nr:hypothetical protein [Acholeplasmatales bacterium]